MSQFIGRRRELARLQELCELKKSSLVVIKGRRRVGKSRLLQEFGHHFDSCYSFVGLAPEDGLTAQDQKLQFADGLRRHFGISGQAATDWNDLFWQLAQQVQEGRVLVILDEISWMAMRDATFLPKLKNAWDEYFSKNAQLIFALCSSISMWVEENVLSSTAFLGRISLELTVRELPLHDCAAFWDEGGWHVSAQEKLTMLSVVGGIPRYLEEINPKRTAEWNIRSLCFSEGGILYQEFEKIFSDLFANRQQRYKDIVCSLINGKLEVSDIRQKIGLSRSGDIYTYIDDLEQAGFITRDHTWSVKSGKESTLSLVRLSDNYTRFYLKYIQPNTRRIKSGGMDNVALTSLPGWSTMIGLQFENLVLNNRHYVKQRLGIDPSEVIYDNPFFQRAGRTKQGCQIDYLIQTNFNQLYVVEIKFSKNPIGIEVIDEVKEKIKRMNLPRNFSYRPILVHCNCIAESVEDAQFFADIIDFSQFL